MLTENLNLIELITTRAQDWLAAGIAATPRIALAIAMLMLFALLIWGTKKLIRSLATRVGLRNSLIDVLKLIASVAGWIAGGLVAVTIVFPTITPANALATLGLGSVAIGFAFKDTFENFLAGVLILLREPFRLNDHIESGGVEGQVERITIRDTHIRQTDGQLVVVPNAHLFHNPVTVRTDKELRRTTIICGVAYGENVDHARDIISKAVSQVDMVRDDVRDVEIFAKSFGASSIELEVTWWTGSRPIDIRASRDKVVAAVKAALDDAGIEIPFPYRTLTLNEPIEIEGFPRPDDDAA